MRERLLEPVKEIATKFWTGLSVVVGAFLIFLVGWIIAKFVRLLLIRFFRMLKLDNLVEDAGLKKMMDKGNITLSASELMATGVYWLVMLVVIFVAISFAGIQIPATVVDSLLGFIPRFILGLLIFIFSMFVGNLFGEIVRTSAANAGVEKAGLLGKITQTAITVFGVVIAL